MSMRAFGVLLVVVTAACSASHRKGPRPSPESPGGQAGSSSPIGGQAGSSSPTISGQAGSRPASGTPSEASGCYEFAAHGDDPSSPFAILPGEQLHVFYYRAPWSEEVEAIRFESDLDAADAIYGWSLYAVPNAQFSPGDHELALGSWISAPETRLLARGAPGAWSWEFLDTALPLPPPNTTLAVEWHHVNASNDTHLDRSVVRVCTEPASATSSVTGALTVLGTEDLNGAEGMPPGEHSFSGACTVLGSRPLQLFAISPRLHRYGVRAEVAIEHGDGTSVLVHDAPFDVADQRFYDVGIDLHPGDRLVTRCTYRNSSEGAVAWGVSAWQENCYLLALTSAAGLRSDGASLWAVDNTCL